MIEIELDGQKVEVQEGCMVMHAAEKAGTYIPHFCYHKKLSIAANCRMCLVDIEKAPKPMPACATPVTQGMVIKTKSEKAVTAQKSVMEFLLINHPLDCPICDQGGECQLQDIAVGYGGAASRYEEEKRVVFHKDVGPLISMQEMSRCIHCTRCVRFGQEIAGVMELGMIHRGEHSEITTIHGNSIDSELSGNMIDICPVGALTSKPFRYSARTWELSRRRSISPHDSTGTNLIVQVKNNKVMRVVPYENEEVNECWIADRDRYSYEALNSQDRLTSPMIKQNGEWNAVSWQVALEYVANGLQSIKHDHGASAIGALVSPHSTVEELYLASKLMRSLGSDSIDSRLRNADFSTSLKEGVRWLGTSIASLSSMQRVFVIGSNLRKEHPLFSQRIRQATRKHGCQVNSVLDQTQDWALPVANSIVEQSSKWLSILLSISAAVAQEKKIENPFPCEVSITSKEFAIARSMLTGQQKIILLGNSAAHHEYASQILLISNWLAEQTESKIGYLTEAANTVGAQLAEAVPLTNGAHAGEMLNGLMKAVLLLNVEPNHDTALKKPASTTFANVQMVVTMSPFKANLDISDVLLPIAPFSETSGSFVNAEGRVQSFHAVVKPLNETRPGWKVIRVLANMLNLPGFDFQSSQDVLLSLFPKNEDGLNIVDKKKLSNKTEVTFKIPEKISTLTPVVANIYQLDGLVRRAPSLQLTVDASVQSDGGVA